MLKCTHSPPSSRDPTAQPFCGACTAPGMCGSLSSHPKGTALPLPVLPTGARPGSLRELAGGSSREAEALGEEKKERS